eukprot:m.52563 g.52563  ORF g.52563 m.52563 type:complete len:105 (+) comp13510_c0_seq2:1014-1328(+)
MSSGSIMSEAMMASCSVNFTPRKVRSCSSDAPHKESYQQKTTLSPQLQLQVRLHQASVTFAVEPLERLSALEHSLLRLLVRWIKLLIKLLHHEIDKQAGYTCCY